MYVKYMFLTGLTMLKFFELSAHILITYYILCTLACYMVLFSLEVKNIKNLCS